MSLSIVLVRYLSFLALLLLYTYTYIRTYIHTFPGPTRSTLFFSGPALLFFSFFCVFELSVSS